MSMFGYEREKCIALINAHTAKAVCEFIKSLHEDKPTCVETEYGGHILTPTHFNNFMVNDICWYLDDLQKEKLDATTKRVTRQGIDLIIKHLDYHAQHTSCETDTTCYAWDYAMAVDKIRAHVKRHFIRTA